MKDAALELVSFPVAPLGCNCTILRCPDTGESAVIDPGGDGPRIIQALEKQGSYVRWIVHTHAHFDHCLATREVAEYARASNKVAREWQTHVGLHRGDMFLYENLGVQCRWFGLPPQEAEEAIDYFLEDTEELAIGRGRLRVLHTPGHTPGSCCFHLEETGMLFSGDTLFAMGIGRTDLPGGDSDTILRSIRERLFTLDDATQVLPGHGPMTRIYEEKRGNPFF
ncbi:MAG: MBL fold metallo-hydrolase [Leptospirales bacterium]|nr:MBL fold metallo-hydrolase [Leptospirales bacterium]